MMKYIIFTGTLLLTSAMTGEAMANCAAGGGWTRVSALVARLNGGLSLGKTACSLAGQGTQEEHHAGGELWDYKLGNTGPGTVDPRKKIGTWSVSNNGSDNATVTYNYDAIGGPVTSGPYAVYRNGPVTNTTTLYDFCSSSTSVGTFTLIVTSGTSRVCP